MEKKFQIKYTDNRGGYSCEYFNASSDFEKKAEETANAYLKKKQEDDDRARLNEFNFFHQFHKPNKTLMVSEYDMEKKCIKRGGIKFKLKLAFIKTVYKGGNTIKQEWYEAVKK